MFLPLSRARSILLTPLLLAGAMAAPAVQAGFAGGYPVAVVASVDTPLLTGINTSIVAMNTTLLAALQAHGAALRTGQMEQEKVLAKIQTAQTEEQRRMMIQEGAAKARVDAEMTFGFHGTPPGECHNAAVASAAAAASAAAKTNGAATRVKQGEHVTAGARLSASSREKRLVDTLKDRPEELDINTLMGPDGVGLGLEPGAAFLDNMLVPSPPMDPPEKDHALAQSWKSKQAEWTAQISLAQQAGAYLNASANTEMDPAVVAALWKSLGLAGTPPAKASIHLLLETLMSGPFESAAWQADIEGKAEKGILQALLYHEIARGRMEVERYRMERMRFAMETARFARETNAHWLPQMDAARADATRSGVERSVTH